MPEVLYIFLGGEGVFERLLELRSPFTTNVGHIILLRFIDLSFRVS